MNNKLESKFVSGETATGRGKTVDKLAAKKKKMIKLSNKKYIIKIKKKKKPKSALCGFFRISELAVWFCTVECATWRVKLAKATKLQQQDKHYQHQRCFQYHQQQLPPRRPRYDVIAISIIIIVSTNSLLAAMIPIDTNYIGIIRTMNIIKAICDTF